MTNPENPMNEQVNKFDINSQDISDIAKTKDLEIDPKTKIFTVPVEIAGAQEMAEKIEIDGRDFTKKPEFHVTIIGSGKAKEFKKAIQANPDLEAEINTIIKSLDWQYVLKPEKFHLTQDKEIVRQLSKQEKKDRHAKGLEEVDSLKEIVHRESVIQLVEMPAFQSFYDRLREKGLDLGEVPPIHITLYTHGDASGIALNSKEDFEGVNPRKIE